MPEVDFVDTADSYGPEISERLIHEALYAHDGILIATKAGLTRPGPGEWQRDGRPDRLRQQAIKSRDRLGLAGRYGQELLGISFVPILE